MLNIDLTGRRALVAGVADDGGFGFAIAKALAEAGASVSVATWPPALNIFTNLIERGKMDESRRLSNGELLQFEKIYPLDAAFDTLSDAPEDIRTNKRYSGTGDFSIEGMVNRIREDFGDKPLDIVIHSLANGSRDEPARIPDRRGRERLLVCRNGEPPRSADAPGRLIPLAHVHGKRAGDTGIWRWDVVGKGCARK
jgi:enoyl-[acyl-carrier-protein] reductase (NADH)